MSLDDRLRKLSLADEHPDVDRALARVRAKAKRALLVRRAGLGAATAAAIAAAIVVPRMLADRDTSREPPTFAPQPTESLPFGCSTSRSGTMILSADRGDLWLYDVAADESKRLTADGEQRHRVGPRFVGNNCVVYRAAGPSIELLPLEGGRPRAIVREKGLIRDHDASPDGSTIIYVHMPDEVGVAVHRLKKVDVSGGSPSVLRTFAPIPGRGAGSEDELSAVWSPDGRMILVTDTHVDQDDSIFLLDAEGRDVVPPWSGTHARWSPDGRTVYYRGYAGRSGLAWHAFDVASQTRTNLGMREGTNNPAISPDGRSIAYDTTYFGDYPPEASISGEPPVVYVYDFRTRKETLLRRGALTAVWISPTEVLVADAVRSDPERSLNSWEWLGTVSKITIGEQRTTASIAGRSLFDAAVLFDG